MEAKEREGHADSGARKAVLAALFGNLGVAVAKLVSALLTGSSAMLAETLHSVADTGNQVFLLLGGELEREVGGGSLLHPRRPV